MNKVLIFRFTYRIITIVLVMHATSVFSQEVVAPLMYKPGNVKQKSTQHMISKTTALSLPFFDDFTSYSPVPDTLKWTDRHVYVNNTTCVDPISRGVATFDGLQGRGIPYDSFNSTTLLYADSLTSQPIDLLTYTPADSIYLSFFYQPQGNGFYPETEDSLMLFFRRNHNKGWAKVWAKEGSTVLPFQQVMIPVTDTAFLYESFQFRFINKASLNTNDDTWNVDYVIMDANRTLFDTAVNDIAFTVNPGYMLNDYTYMPYNHFIADPGSERVLQHQTVIRNNTNTAQSVIYGTTAREKQSNTFLANGGTNTVNIPPYTSQSIVFNTYTNTVPAPDEYANFENTYYITQGGATGPVNNDTIVREQVFHNFFAYDDGTAEKSYYLNMFSSLPAKIAVEHHLNVDDTLKGVGIYFGRQVPFSNYKYFSIAVYRDIGMGGGAEQLVYQEDFLDPWYMDINNFHIYKFETPVILPKGTYYVGTIQPALSNSDSLYIGLDVNRIGGNHAYYNVLGFWESSSVSGALMIRPMFGTVFSSNIERLPIKSFEVSWSVSPDPVSDRIRFNYNSNKQASYEIYNMEGRKVKTGIVMALQEVNMSDLAHGIYFVRLYLDGYTSKPQKIIKL